MFLQIRARFWHGHRILLFVAAAFVAPIALGSQIFVAQDVNPLAWGAISIYDSASGSPINTDSFLGPDHPSDIAVSGSTVYCLDQGRISTWTMSGQPINSNIASIGAATSLAVSGDRLYVCTLGKVAEYTTSGQVVNANFITGLNAGIRIALSGDDLFLLDGGGDWVSEYNATTGNPINTRLISTVGTNLGPMEGIAVSDDSLFVSFSGDGIINGGHIGKYSLSGVPINTNFVTGLTNPLGISVDDGNLYATDDGPLARGTGSIRKYDASTGATIDANFITGLYSPVSVIALPEPSTWLLMAFGISLSIGFCLRHKPQTQT